MSDEPKVLAATVMRSLPSGAYHARRALAALESQNQALQEALERAWKHEEESHAYCSAFSPALERAALSPTQETDHVET